ncbi:Alanine--glyoxylate aminotransferase 23, mitochondrial [Sesamum angolense]|uniref:Alanine--glyoxylate aminotransferase 23, mitochondrial n=1 Tax=Sesamum angolense TaxID=2727404 RepID=A0AAE1X9E9_9LAMI|nr:Alanine--glyoxylate aminotransferase 23, mitochondrial [Sesamum angolense]
MAMQLPQWLPQLRVAISLMLYRLESTMHRIQTSTEASSALMDEGVGGIMELAPGYLPAVYDSIRKAGGLCIADEVQSGFARTGSHFWGFEAHDVVPDIVTMAKGIGNGIPLGAVVTTPEIAKVLACRNYYNTYGGNPVFIGDVRGRGLLVGVELVTDRQLQTPAKIETLRVMEQMKEMGVLIGKGGSLAMYSGSHHPCFTTLRRIF